MGVSKKLTRARLSPFMANLPACTVAMEACGSAHHWARTFRAFGHEVRLIAPQFVKPYGKSNKNANHRFERAAPPASFACCLRAPQAKRYRLHRLQTGP